MRIRVDAAFKRWLVSRVEYELFMIGDCFARTRD